MLLIVMSMHRTDLRSFEKRVMTKRFENKNKQRLAKKTNFTRIQPVQINCLEVSHALAAG